MEISYINKSFKHTELERVSFDLYEYEITEEDLVLLSEDSYQVTDYIPRRILLHKDKVYDLIIDNIEKGRIIIGGITKEKKAILNYYIVYKGLDEVLKTLSLI